MIPTFNLLYFRLKHFNTPLRSKLDAWGEPCGGHKSLGFPACLTGSVGRAFDFRLRELGLIPGRSQSSGLAFRVTAPMQQWDPLTPVFTCELSIWYICTSATAHASTAFNFKKHLTRFGNLNPLKHIFLFFIVFPCGKFTVIHFPHEIVWALLNVRVKTGNILSQNQPKCWKILEYGQCKVL